MSLLDCYNYINNNNFKFHNDPYRRSKTYYNAIKRPTHDHKQFDTSNIINRVERLIETYGDDTMCIVVFHWYKRELIPYDVSLQPYSKEIHIKILLCQALDIFKLMHVKRTITNYFIDVLE